MKRTQLIFPKEYDYPNLLKTLGSKKQTAKYHQLIEASASAYFETKGFTRWMFLNRFDLALKYLEEISSINRLLDAGTGIGFFLPTLSKTAKNIIAIDNTDYSLKYAKKMCEKRKIDNVVFKKTYLEKLPFKNNQFETIVCLSVLEHVLPKNLPIVINHFYRVLKPNGILIAGYPNEGSSLFKFLQTAERSLIRRKAFKAFNEQDRDKYKTLGHVATAKQIERTIKQRFAVSDYKSLPISGLKLYCLGKYCKN
jgi:ubiquinone/menaquinone biosynthesis C-methylase UbiE